MAAIILDFACLAFITLNRSKSVKLALLLLAISFLAQELFSHCDKTSCSYLKHIKAFRIYFVLAFIFFMCFETKSLSPIDYVGVVFDRVADDMVRIVRSLPPPRADAGEGVPNRRTEEVVPIEAARNARVAEVVAQTSNLLPEQAHQQCAAHVRRHFHADEG